ncbi:hypothetical protein [Rhodopirellula bahusiensis]|uniref:hypothetical protein n=1 Tax=Rhodopirellula bahusiensis TaxID=2014065 RepID=UPI0032674E03
MITERNESGPAGKSKTSSPPLWTRTLVEKEQGNGTVTVVMHAGATDVENAEEKPLTDFPGNEAPADRVPFDWSVRETCPFDKVCAGTCSCAKRNVTIEIWIAERISLDELIVPDNFVVKSGGEIERFVLRHSNDD